MVKLTQNIKQSFLNSTNEETEWTITVGIET